jgi:hypothetical protein
MINGVNYTFEKLIANINGVPSIDLQSIEYSSEQDVQENYGTGNQIISMGRGKKSYKGKIGFTMDTVNALNRASATGDLLDLPAFPISVVYLSDTGQITKHVVIDVVFTSNEVKAKIGDAGLMAELPFKARGIKKESF